MKDETTYEAVPRATRKGYDRVLRVRLAGRDADPVRQITTVAYTKGLENAELVADALRKALG